MHINERARSLALHLFDTFLDFSDLSLNNFVAVHHDSEFGGATRVRILKPIEMLRERNIILDEIRED